MEPILLEIPHAWTDDELYDFCLANRNLFIERTSEGQIIIMAPAGGISSNFSLRVATAIELWNGRNHAPGITFDSSAGFRLPNGAMRSPDAAWIEKSRWDALSQDDKQKFPPLCPDFIVEVRSPSDALKTLQDKMQEWLDNGCQLAWLIDPAERKVYVYQADKAVECVEGFSQRLSGENILPGFYFDLTVLNA